MTAIPCDGDPGKERLRRRGGWQEDHLLGRCGPPYGPRNTWSNAAYALAGAAVWAAHPNPWAGFVLFLACLTLAIGSGLYHAFKTPGSNALDHFGMYAVFASLAVIGGAPEHPDVALFAFIFAFVFAAWGTWWRIKSDLNTTVGVLLGITSLWGFALGDAKATLAALLVYAFAYVLQRADQRHVPWLSGWGHAFWHVLTAVAIYLTALAQLR